MTAVDRPGVFVRRRACVLVVGVDVWSLCEMAHEAGLAHPASLSGGLTTSIGAVHVRRGLDA